MNGAGGKKGGGVFRPDEFIPKSTVQSDSEIEAALIQSLGQPQTSG